jgi:hypothetical protein
VKQCLFHHPASDICSPASAEMPPRCTASEAEIHFKEFVVTTSASVIKSQGKLFLEKFFNSSHHLKYKVRENFFSPFPNTIHLHSNIHLPIYNITVYKGKKIITE